MNKIDFALIFEVRNANPNGDPLNGNRPRENYEGYGEVSDVCIKRKIRNRFMDFGYDIFVQSDDRKVDGYKCLQERAEATIQANNKEEYAKRACEKWLDVRTFGQVFAFKGTKTKKKKTKKNEVTENDTEKDSTSVGIRGPVTIQTAISLRPIDISSMQITKSVNGEPPKNNSTKSSDTMGMKHTVDNAIYVTYGSINSQLAEKTGFTEEDAQVVKEALISLFENDCSSARPAGSMEVCKVIWWKHNCPAGQYSSAKVHRSLKIEPKDNIEEPKGFEDYTFRIEPLNELELEVYDGV